MADEDFTGGVKMDQFIKMFEAFTVPGLDVKAMVEGQRKNLDAMKEAAQIMAVGASDLAKKQTEIVRTAVQQAMSVTGEMRVGDMAAASKMQQEFVKKAFETGLNNARELAEIVGRSNQEAFQTIEQRVRENVEQLRSTAQRNASAMQDAT